MLEKGMVVKNFKLEKQIGSFLELYKVLKSQKSIFWRFGVFPTAFFMQWQVTTLDDSIKHGAFWTIKKA